MWVDFSPLLSSVPRRESFLSSQLCAGGLVSARCSSWNCRLDLCPQVVIRTPILGTPAFRWASVSLLWLWFPSWFLALGKFCPAFELRYVLRERKESDASCYICIVYVWSVGVGKWTFSIFLGFHLGHSPCGKKENKIPTSSSRFTLSLPYPSTNVNIPYCRSPHHSLLSLTQPCFIHVGLLSMPEACKFVTPSESILPPWGWIQVWVFSVPLVPNQRMAKMKKWMGKEESMKDSGKS